MADTRMVIGGFSLSEWEIPEKVSIGGEHILVEHVLIGGNRFWDAMGPKHDAITWKGRFRGPSALSRAQSLDQARIAGQQIELTFFDVSKTVVIRKFRADIERFYEVPYEITCEVVTDDGNAGLSGIAGALDGLLNADMLAALEGADGASAAIGAALAPLSAAVSASTGLTQATNAELMAFDQVAVSASAGVQSIADTAEAAIDVSPGMTAEIDPDVMVSWLLSQGTNVTTESQALDVVPYVNRMVLNVENAGK